MQNSTSCYLGITHWGK